MAGIEPAAAVQARNLPIELHAKTTFGETKAIVVQPTKNPAETRQGTLLHFQLAVVVL